MNVADIRADLIAEQDALDDLVADLPDDRWALPTPSPRWTIADQIGHLAYFDWTAKLAIIDPERFKELVAELMSTMIPANDSDAGDSDADAGDLSDQITLGNYRAMSAKQLLEAWRANRRDLADASATLTDDDRVIWYGPSMGSKSFLTARLMEVWAHGQDIADTLGIQKESTDRIKHIAQLGYITHKWTYINRGLDAPVDPVRVELVAPSGAIWEFGPDDATDTIAGPAADFCLVVTQRRHVDDTDLRVTGQVARDWMEKAQAFAGPATDGPDADTF